MTNRHLKKLSIFHGFKNMELEMFVGGSRQQVLQRGHEIFRSGQSRDTFFIILEGEVEIVKELGGMREIVTIASSGEYIAEEALFQKSSKHSHTCFVRSETAIVLAIKRQIFEKFPESMRLTFILNLLPLISENFAHASTIIVTLSKIGALLGENRETVLSLGTRILSILREPTKAERGIILMIENDASHVKMRAITGFQDTAYLNNRIGLNEDFIAERIVQKGKTVNIREAEYLPRTRKVRYASRSIIGVPLKVRGRQIGAIILADRKGDDGFTPNDEALISIVAHTVGIAIHNAEHFEIQEAEAELKREYVM